MKCNVPFYEEVRLIAELCLDRGNLRSGLQELIRLTASKALLMHMSLRLPPECAGDGCITICPGSRFI